MIGKICMIFYISITYVILRVVCTDGDKEEKRNLWNIKECKKYSNEYFTFLGSRASETAQEPRKWVFLNFLKKVVGAELKTTAQVLEVCAKSKSDAYVVKKWCVRGRKWYVRGQRWIGVGGYPAKKIRTNIT